MLTDEQREALEWAIAQAYAYPHPIEGESLMMKRGKALCEVVLAASPAPADGGELTAMIDNNIESLGNVATAADEKSLPGLAKLLRKVGDTLTRCRALVSPAEGREAVDERAALTPEWLWGELMDYCKERGIAPAQHDPLFRIVKRARAALATAPTKPSEGQVHAITDWPGYWIDGQKVAHQDYIAWLLKQLEATEAARLPEPKYYGSQEGDGDQHDVKCAYVDGWNDCRKAMPATAPTMSEAVRGAHSAQALLHEAACECMSPEQTDKYEALFVGADDLPLRFLRCILKRIDRAGAST